MQFGSSQGARVARRAFTLVELLVVIAIIALLISILLPSLGCARKAARQTQSFVNMKNLSAAGFNYGGDFKDKIASFTWKANKPYQLTTGINATGYTTTTVNSGSDLEAAANQALDIIRRRSGPVNVTVATSMNDWIPHPTYSHLVLMDFLSARLPEPMLLDPSDRFRQDMAEKLRTSADPGGYCNALPGTNGGIRSTWPYSSSYQFVPASYCPDKETADGGYLRQADGQIYYQYSAGSQGRYRLGERKLGDVQFPAQKVFLMQDVGRAHCKKEYPWLHPNSSFGIVAFDGQIRQSKAQDMNRGGYTRSNGRLALAVATYIPRIEWGYPDWPDGNIIAQDVPMLCRWTYRGLKGVDFGGLEPADGNW